MSEPTKNENPADLKAFKILSDALTGEIVSLHKWYGHSATNIMECSECAAMEMTARMIHALREGLALQCKIDWREALFNILDAVARCEGVVFEKEWTEHGVSEAERDLILSHWKAREK